MAKLTPEEQKSLQSLMGIWVKLKCDNCGHALIRPLTYSGKKSDIYCSAECRSEKTGVAMPKMKQESGEVIDSGKPVGCEDKILDAMMQDKKTVWTAKSLTDAVGGYSRRDIRKAVNNLIARKQVERDGKALLLTNGSDNGKQGREASIDGAAKRHGVVDDKDKGKKGKGDKKGKLTRKEKRELRLQKQREEKDQAAAAKKAKKPSKSKTNKPVRKVRRKRG